MDDDEDNDVETIKATPNVEDVTTAKQETKEVRRSGRNKRAPARYVPETGVWQKEDNDEEANVVFIPMHRHGEQEVIDAKNAELNNWKATEAVDEVEDNGQKLISTRWVITEKEIAPGKFKPKARLVVRGFEESNEIQVDAPTASKAALRTVLAIGANKQWSLEHIDIKSAFLQGRKIERNVFVKPPDEAATGNKVWRLRKAAYGLVDAARNWYLSVKEVLTQLGCLQSNLDKAVFRWYENNNLLGAVVLHVDDFLFAGTDLFHQKVTEQVATKFDIGMRKTNAFKYVGLNVCKVNGEIVLQQDEYVNELQELEVELSRDDTALTKEEMRLLREITGQLLWISPAQPDL